MPGSVASRSHKGRRVRCVNRTHAHDAKLTYCVKIMQMIAEYLENDIDMLNYAILCKATKNSIIDDSVFCIRFKRMFDRIDLGVSAEHISKQYKARKRVSRTFIPFDQGPKQTHSACLTMLRDLILGTFDRNGMSHNKLLIISQSQTLR
jgi:hypothetical protein